jgi:hypothetical protein
VGVDVLLLNAVRIERGVRLVELTPAADADCRRPCGLLR